MTRPRLDEADWSRMRRRMAGAAKKSEVCVPGSLELRVRESPRDPRAAGGAAALAQGVAPESNDAQEQWVAPGRAGPPMQQECDELVTLTPDR